MSHAVPEWLVARRASRSPRSAACPALAAGRAVARRRAPRGGAPGPRAGAGSAAAVWALLARLGRRWRSRWPVPGGAFAVRVDALSALFLLQIFVIALLGSIYGLELLAAGASTPTNGRKLRLFYGLLTAGHGAARGRAQRACSSSSGWEIMALAAFLLITTEDEQADGARGRLRLPRRDAPRHALPVRDVRAAARAPRARFDLGGAAAPTPASPRAIFLLGLVGFGLKAGHHAAARLAARRARQRAQPRLGAHVGRAHQDGHLRPRAPLVALPAPAALVGRRRCSRSARSRASSASPSPSASTTSSGCSPTTASRTSASSASGSALALLGRALGRAELVVARARRRAAARLEPRAVQGAALPQRRLGPARDRHARDRSARRARASGCRGRRSRFLVGAVAICGLPPLNGFVSELLDLPRAVPRGVEPRRPRCGSPAPSPRRRWRSSARSPSPASSRSFGAGVPRRAALATPPRRAHESGPRRCSRPMAVLARAVRRSSASAPPLVAPAARPRRGGVGAGDRPSERAARGARAARLRSRCAAVALVAGARGSARRRCARSARRARRRAAVGTWDCGYAAPTARMQYTVVVVRPDAGRLLRLGAAPATSTARASTASFPAPGAFHSHVPDTVLDRAVLPGVARRRRAASRGSAGSSAAACSAYLALHPRHARGPARCGDELVIARPHRRPRRAGRWCCRRCCSA